MIAINAFYLDVLAHFSFVFALYVSSVSFNFHTFRKIPFRKSDDFFTSKGDIQLILESIFWYQGL